MSHWEVDGRAVSPTTETDSVVGRELVFADRSHDVGVAAMMLVPGLLLLVPTALFVGGMLSLLTGAFSAILLYAGVGVVRADVGKRRPREARYGLRRVVYRDRDGERVLRLDEGLEHPLGQWAPPALRGVLQARAALSDQPDDSNMRRAMEWAAWKRFEGGRPFIYVIVQNGAPIHSTPDFEEPDELERLTRAGAEVFRLQLRPTGDGSKPVYERRAIRRVKRLAHPD